MADDSVRLLEEKRAKRAEYIRQWKENMSAERKAELAAKHREDAAKWRAENPEKVKASTAKSYAQNATSRRRAAREWYAANKNRQREYKKSRLQIDGERRRQRYANATPDQIEQRRAKRAAEYQRLDKDLNRASRRKWRRANPDIARQRNRKDYERRREKILAHHKQYYESNKANFTEYTATRRQRLRQSIPAWADRTAIRAIYRQARRLTIETGIQHDVDHIVPLQGETVCGLHWEGNLQILTEFQNARKANKLIEDHIQFDMSR